MFEYKLTKEQMDNVRLETYDNLTVVLMYLAGGLHK